MKLVVIESPYASGATDSISARLADVAANNVYLQRCLRDSLLRGEAPFASHKMYTEAFQDLIPEERAKGIAAGLEWARVAEKSAVYIDRGVSPGMQFGVRAAHEKGREVEYRQLYARDCLHEKLSTECAVGRFRCMGCNAQWTGVETVPSGYTSWGNYVEVCALPYAQVDFAIELFASSLLEQSVHEAARAVISKLRAHYGEAL